MMYCNLGKTDMAAAILQSGQMPEPLAVVHTNRAFNCDPPQRYIHKEHILSVLLKGEGSYRNGPFDVPLGRPVAALLPAGDEDVNGLVGPGESWFVGFHWPGVKLASDANREISITAFETTIAVPRWKRLEGADLARFTQQFGRLHSAFQRQDIAGAIQSRALLMELFAMYLEFPEDDGVNTGHRALARFCELLQVRCCEDVTIETIADEAGISADHLRDLFRARFGMRPVEYRTGLRLARARELLASTTLNVKEVAHRTGYPDALYFSRVFKERFGIVPSEVILRFRLPSKGLTPDL
jgi:AraC-like DNA-binding protein